MKRTKQIFGLLALMLILASCNRDSTFRGWVYMPDMYDGPALETYSPNGMFKDSASARLPVSGTVPRGFLAYQSYSPDASGYDSAKASLKMPGLVATDSMALAEGKEIYNIFCNHCHGDQGAGQGVLVKSGKYVGVPSYADRDINLGSIFHVVTYGKGVMGAHASQLTPEERWKVAQYVLQLRKAQLTEAGLAEANTDTTQTQG